MLKKPYPVLVEKNNCPYTFREFRCQPKTRVFWARPWEGVGVLKIDLAYIRALNKAVVTSTSNPHALYTNDARAKAWTAVESLRQNAREVGCPDEVVGAITAFISEDGHVYVGIPRNDPNYETAFDIEYGSLDGNPRPFLRTLRVEWE